MSFALSAVAAQAGAIFTLSSASALDAPIHQPGDEIVVSASASPVVGPVGGTTRVVDLTVQVEAGAGIIGGEAPRLDAWWGMVTDTVGVRTGAGSSVFNAGLIQAGSAVLPSGPAPEPASIRPLAEYTAILDQPAVDLGQPVFDADASRAAALVTAVAAEQRVAAAATGVRDQLAALQQRSDAAAAARPEPWIDPRQVDLSGSSDPDDRWNGAGAVYGYSGTTFPSAYTIGSGRVVAVEADDDSLIVNAGRIASDQDGIVAGSENRIVNAGTLDTGRDGINVRDGNSIANTGAIDAGGDGINAQDRNVIRNGGTISAGDDGVDARDGNIIANIGAIDAGDRGIGTGNDAAVVNSGSISAGDTGIAAGERAVVTNAGTIVSAGGGIEFGGDGAALNTGTINADDAAINAGSSGVIDNRGTLSGGLNAISAGSGSVVTNTGTVTGGIDLRPDGVVVNEGEVTGRIGADVVVNTGRIGGTYADSGSVLSIGSSTGELHGTRLLNTGAVTSSEDGLQGGTLVNEGSVDAGYWGLQIDGGGVARNTGSLSGGAIGVLAFDSAGTGFVNSGTVAAGNVGQGRAIDLSESSGDNTVALLSGSDLIGNVAGGLGQDSLILDGSGAEDADIADFERVAVIGDDWSLTGNIDAGEVLAANGSLMLDGTVTGDVYVYNDATLSGDGAISGLLIAAGTIAPGNGIGHLVVDGDAVVNPGGRLVIEVGGAAPGLFDTFATTDDIFFDGILEFVFDVDADLDLNDMLDDVLDGVLAYDGLLVGPNSEILWSGLPLGWYLEPTLGADALDIAFGYRDTFTYGVEMLAGSFGNVSNELQQVPAPASALMIGFGLFGLQLFRRIDLARR